jgi:beta-galactosidase
MRPAARLSSVADSNSPLNAAAPVGVGEQGGAHWFSSSGAAASEVAPQTPVSEIPPGGGLAVAVGAAQQAMDVEGHVTVSCIVTLDASGRLTMRWTLDASHALPAPLAASLCASLPRVGLHALVAPHLQHARWYGRGPHECYPDRKTAARLAIHSM